MTAARVPPENFTLNANDGNKLMAMGFIEAAKGAGIGKIVYADTAHDRIEFVHPEGLPPEPMGKLATLEDLFESRGLRIVRMDSDKPKWQQRARERSELTRWLFELSRKRPSPLGKLRTNLNPKGEHHGSTARWSNACSKPAYLSQKPDQRIRNWKP